jgi:hypothetical protein
LWRLWGDHIVLRSSGESSEDIGWVAKGGYGLLRHTAAQPLPLVVLFEQDGFMRMARRSFIGLFV